MLMRTKRKIIWMMKVIKDLKMAITGLLKSWAQYNGTERVKIKWFNWIQIIQSKNVKSSLYCINLYIYKIYCHSKVHIWTSRACCSRSNVKVCSFTRFNIKAVLDKKKAKVDKAAPSRDANVSTQLVISLDTLVLWEAVLHGPKLSWMKLSSRFSAAVSNPKITMIACSDSNAKCFMKSQDFTKNTDLLANLSTSVEVLGWWFFRSVWICAP